MWGGVGWGVEWHGGVIGRALALWLVDLNASPLKRLPLMPLTQGTDRRNALLRVEGRIEITYIG